MGSMRNSMAGNRDPNELSCKRSEDKMQTTAPGQAQAFPILPKKERIDRWRGTLTLHRALTSQPTPRAASQVRHRHQPSTMTFWPFRRRDAPDASTSETTGKMISFWPSRVRKQETARAHELRIATSGSSSINALVELVGGGVASQPAHRVVRAAIFAPGAATTLEFDAPGPAEPSRKLGTCARGERGASCVHALRLLTPEQTTAVLDDVKRIGESIGWSDRGVSLPTQDVLVSKLSKESQNLVFCAIRETILPFARQHYPHLNASFDKQPYPRPGNLFIVRYCASSKRPGGRGLKLHKDETKLTFNLCLSPEEGFTGGGTYFPANSADVDGLLVRPKPGCCLVHDGNLKHAGMEVVSGQRFILVGFYNADGCDRVGEEEHFTKAALEEQRTHSPPQEVQTIYFNTAVASARDSSPAAAQGRPRPAAASQLSPPLVPPPAAEGATCSADPGPVGGNTSSADPLGPTGAGASPAASTPITEDNEITTAGGLSGASSARGDAATPALERPLLFAGGGCAADANTIDADAANAINNDADNADAAAGTVLYKPFESACSDPSTSTVTGRPAQEAAPTAGQAEREGSLGGCRVGGLCLAKQAEGVTALPLA